MKKSLDVQKSLQRSLEVMMMMLVGAGKNSRSNAVVQAKRPERGVGWVQGPLGKALALIGLQEQVIEGGSKVSKT